MNIGSSNRLAYDPCSYKKKLHESTSPLAYRLYEGNYENCSKCVYDKFWRPFDTEIVDIESELKNINRPVSHCDEYFYNPNCKKSGSCVSTYDKTIPIVWSNSLCSVVKNNIVKPTHPGYVLPPKNICANVKYQTQ